MDFYSWIQTLWISLGRKVHHYKPTKQCYYYFTQVYIYPWNQNTLEPGYPGTWNILEPGISWSQKYPGARIPWNLEYPGDSDCCLGQLLMINCIVRKF